jgi:hypothetical protein
MEKNDILISHGLGLHAIVGPITPAGLERRTGQIEHSLSSSSEKNPELIDKFMSVTYLEFFSASDLINQSQQDRFDKSQATIGIHGESQLRDRTLAGGTPCYGHLPHVAAGRLACRRRLPCLPGSGELRRCLVVLPSQRPSTVR